MLIAEAYRRTEECLALHKDNLKLMAEALLAKETLNYDDVEKLLGPPPHGKKHLVSIFTNLVHVDCFKKLYHSTTTNICSYLDKWSSFLERSSLEMVIEI